MSDESAAMEAKPDSIRSECRSVLPRYVLLTIVIGTILAIWWKCNYDPSVIFLRQETSGEWVGIRRPFELNSRRNEQMLDRTEFRKEFASKNSSQPIALKVKFFRRVEIFLDSRSIYRSCENDNQRNWRQPVTVPLSDPISPGTHELRLVVENSNGPALIWVSCEGLGLKTDATWQARQKKSDWLSAMTVLETPETPEIVTRYGSPFESMQKLWPWFAVMFSGCGIVTFFATRKLSHNPLQTRTRSSINNPKLVRMMLYLFWVVFAIHSLKNVPIQGFDFPAHLLYIESMTTHWLPPFATDGWQMFQTPLYYYVASWFLQLGTAISSVQTGFVLVQGVSLVCGMLQIELCYRYAILFFPERDDLKVWGMMIGGLLPMNLYMSQGIGNEPIAGVLIAWVFYISLKMYRQPEAQRTNKSLCILGMALGLAILAKVTAVLVIPPIFLLWYLSARLHSQAWKTVWKSSWKAVMIASSMCVLVCGWYFLRNWLELGTPYMGGWDSARGIAWWQDPGFRSFDQLTRFGRVMTEPIYASRFGLWDALYSSFWWDGYLGGVINFDSRPLWREDWMLASVWFSVAPMGLLCVGLLRGLRKTLSSYANELSVMTIFITIYFAAIAWLYLRLPIYSTAKASYMMGLIPVYGVLAALGMEWLGRNRWIKMILHGSLGCWFLAITLAYFSR